MAQIGETEYIVLWWEKQILNHIHPKREIHIKYLLFLISQLSKSRGKLPPSAPYFFIAVHKQSL